MHGSLTGARGGSSNRPADHRGCYGALDVRLAPPWVWAAASEARQAAGSVLCAGRVRSLGMCASLAGAPQGDAGQACAHIHAMPGLVHGESGGTADHQQVGGVWGVALERPSRGLRALLTVFS